MKLPKGQREALRATIKDLGSAWRMTEGCCIRNGDVVLRPIQWSDDMKVRRWVCWPTNQINLFARGRTAREALRNAAKKLDGYVETLTFARDTCLLFVEKS